ncbi:uncharacterized protein LOC132168178 [Corylus avellana]|uniref:uncharacterized protein LOC132168178 n=1 Tax=Corylus avellana TaxID=13451 RepID=UPI00286A69BB|nr:uncharacterized protein LOC132168178 [Corylus avellana]XP_059435277.1 uncharacterized protein LOC132168178 [Corylus avellana]
MEMDVEEVEHKEVPKCEYEVVCMQDLVGCECSELEERSKKAEAKCVELELDIHRNKSEYEVLETKFKALEVDKLEIEDELKVLKRENDELKKLVSGFEGERKVSSGSERDMNRIVDLMEENQEEDKLIQLLIEISVLECEKKRAESEVEVWKEKFKEMESLVLVLNENSVLRCVEWPLIGGTKTGFGLQNVTHDVRVKKEAVEAIETLVKVGSTICHSPVKGIGDLKAAGTPCNDFTYREDACIKEEKKGLCLAYGRRVRKQLSFEEARSPSKKLAPSTPAGARPASLGIIDISDSDDEQTTHILSPASNDEVIDKVHISEDCTLGLSMGSENGKNSGNSLKRIHYDEVEDDTDAWKENLLFTPTPKKRAFNVFTSDTESDEDDNVPISKLISKLKRMRLLEKVPDEEGSDLNDCSDTATSLGDNVTGSVTPQRRHLMALRKSVGKGGAERNSSSQASKTKYDRGGILACEDAEDDDSEEFGSDSEGESLGGFIVGGSDVSDVDDASSESQEVSDENSDFDEIKSENTDFDEILSKLQRNQDHKLKWEFEADILAAFGKDTELCMKAVCALFRQQTSGEKSSKEAFYSNHRGFSKFDAPRGSTLAEFLTDGDPEGDLKKSVKELQEYDPEAVQLCRRLATHYSKQLFEIYKNKEDPFFLPS